MKILTTQFQHPAFFGQKFAYLLACLFIYLFLCKHISLQRFISILLQCPVVLGVSLLQQLSQGTNAFFPGLFLWEQEDIKKRVSYCS